MLNRRKSIPLKLVFTMNLKFHLLPRIILIAVACLIATAAYVLYQADQQAILETKLTAESIDKQLELQLMRAWVNRNVTLILTCGKRRVPHPAFVSVIYQRITVSSAAFAMAQK